MESTIPEVVAKNALKSPLESMSTEDEDEWYQKWYRCLDCECAFMADDPKYCPGCGKKIIGIKQGGTTIYEQKPNS